MPKLAGVRPRVKLMSHQVEILKKICCDAEGATGCAVSLGTAAQLLRLGMVRLVPTKDAIEYLTGNQVLSPAQVEQWCYVMRIRPPKEQKEPKITKKQRELQEAIDRAEEADRKWKEERFAAQK